MRPARTAPTWPWLLVALLPSVALAENPERGGQGSSTQTRLVGASSVRSIGEGILSVGGSQLRYLAPEARNWRTLHAVPGDNLYRTAVDELNERVLAAWEKDPFLHSFSLRTGQHVRVPRPPPLQQHLGLSNLHSIAYSSDGAVALVFMTSTAGSRGGTFVLYRVALDENAQPEELLRQDGALVLATGGFGVVLALPRSPKERCSPAECFPNMSRIVAYELGATGLQEKTLLSAEQVQVRKARQVRSQDPELIAFELELTRQGRGILVYRRADGTAAFQELAPPTFVSQPTRMAVVAREPRELISLKTLGTDIEVHREPVGRAGGARIERLSSRHNYTEPVYAFGIRPNGTLWLHWGDSLALVDSQGAMRGVDLRPLAGRMTEWAGADLYVDESDTLWIGVEVGPGRDFVRVRVGDVDAAAKRWPGKGTGCGVLPGVAKLMQWPAQEHSCGGGMPNPRAPKPKPLEVVKVLPDGSKIINAGARGCIRIREVPCTKKCLPPHALIATPMGDVRLADLRAGMPVWTRDVDGNRVRGTVLRTHLEHVTPAHRMVRVQLADGRAFMASPGHPTASGAGVELLRPQESYDGTEVVSIELVHYGLRETRDLLPSGDTGIYWADGVPLGSTL